MATVTNTESKITKSPRARDGSTRYTTPAMQGAASDTQLAAAHQPQKVLGPLQRAKWKLAVLMELAAPAYLEFDAVTGDDGQVLDFMWSRTTPLAKVMLGCAGADTTGRTLRGFLSDQKLGAALLDSYQRAFVSKTSHVLRLNIGYWSGIHEVRPSPLGVAVVITSSAAAERVIAARRTVRALEALSRFYPLRAKFSIGQLAVLSQ